MPRKKPQQLTLNVRKYLVRGDGLGDLEVQAASRSAAKWDTYKRWRAAGFFTGGFGEFLGRRVTARELRRA